eukprot:6178071-Pleurochrysis_carterae.AAC.5
MKKAVKAELASCRKELVELTTTREETSKQVAAERAKAGRLIESLQAELKECNFRRAHHCRGAAETKGDLHNLRQAQLALREKMGDVTKLLTVAHTKEATQLRGEARDQRSSDRGRYPPLPRCCSSQQPSYASTKLLKLQRKLVMRWTLRRRRRSSLLKKVRTTKSDRDVQQTALKTISHQAMLLLNVGLNAHC